MIMDVFQELLVTVLFVAVLSFIVTKVVVARGSTGDVSQPSEIEGVGIVSRAQSRGMESEARVRVDGGVEKVDRFSGERLAHELPEEVVPDVIGGADRGTAVENAVAAASGEKIVENSKADGFSSEGTVDESVKLDEFDGVDEGNAVAMVCGEKIVEHLTVDDRIVRYVESDDDSFENSGAVCENVETIGLEGDTRVSLGSSDPVVDDEVAAEEGSGGGKSDKLDGMVGGDTVARVSEVKVVEHVGPDQDMFESYGVSDIMVKLGGYGDVALAQDGENPSTRIEDVEGIKDASFDEKIVEDVGVDNDGSDNPGANIDSVENVGAVGDITVNPGVCDGVLTQGLEIKDEKKWLIADETDEKGKVEDAIIRNLGGSRERDEKGKGFIDEDDDDWEGIERSELGEDFATAANYVYCGDKKVKFDSDVEMELYGLNKVALEGPCREPQPMAIKVSARAKWNAWQRLGNMSPEVAMEQYISLLSDKAPEWMEGKSSGDGSKDSSRLSEASPPNIGTHPENQLDPPVKESALELNSTTNEGDPTSGSIHAKTYSG